MNEITQKMLSLINDDNEPYNRGYAAGLSIIDDVLCPYPPYTKESYQWMQNPFSYIKERNNFLSWRIGHDQGLVFAFETSNKKIVL